jgi:hypothetical protein
MGLPDQPAISAGLVPGLLPAFPGTLFRGLVRYSIAIRNYTITPFLMAQNNNSYGL